MGGAAMSRRMRATEAPASCGSDLQQMAERLDQRELGDSHEAKDRPLDSRLHPEIAAVCP
jgi:hypothetical protein